jgi:glyoxylase-like metal-dependent hydrolase (beta-lactamase superfamily II)
LLAARHGPGWTLVDCGVNTDDIFEIWDKLWRGLLRSRPLQNLTLTPAHIGFAGYLVKECEMHGAPAACRMAQRVDDVA